MPYRHNGPPLPLAETHLRKRGESIQRSRASGSFKYSDSLLVCQRPATTKFARLPRHEADSGCSTSAPPYLLHRTPAPSAYLPLRRRPPKSNSPYTWRPTPVAPSRTPLALATATARRPPVPPSTMAQSGNSGRRATPAAPNPVPAGNLFPGSPLPWNGIFDVIGGISKRRREWRLAVHSLAIRRELSGAEIR